MYVENRYLEHRTVRKRHHIVFIVTAVVIIISIAVDLSLHEWFKYCWWDFGLVHASSFTTFTNFDNESTVSDVYSDSCQSLKSLVEDNCPNFCTYLNRIEIGGIFMIIFGTLSLIFYFIIVLFHVWSFFKVAFKFKKIWVFLVLPSIFYLSGIIIYNCCVNILVIENPKTGKFDIASPKIEVGMYYSYTIIPFTLLHTAYGLIKTRIAFK